MGGITIFENEIRSKIGAFINLHPGIHYSGLKSKLELSNGTLNFHLKKLVKRNVIYAKKEGRYKRFYPDGFSLEDRPFLTDFQHDLLNTIKETPGISKVELSYLFDRSRQGINHNVNVLSQKGIILRRTRGGKVYLYFKNYRMDKTEEKVSEN